MSRVSRAAAWALLLNAWCKAGPADGLAGCEAAVSPSADSFSAALMCFLDVRCASYTVFFVYCFWPG